MAYRRAPLQGTLVTSGVPNNWDMNTARNAGMRGAIETKSQVRGLKPWPRKGDAIGDVSVDTTADSIVDNGLHCLRDDHR